MNAAVKACLYNCAKTAGRPIGVYPFPKTYRRHLLDILERLQISCVIDVGAHFGEWGTILRGIGYQGTILSFEPVSGSFELLERAARNDQKWKVYPFALGEAESTATIHLYKSSDFNSLLAPQTSIQDQFNEDVHEMGKEDINVRRLDKFLLDLELSDMAIYLKMDTQGFDQKVVAGALGVLNRVVAMQSELPGARPIYRDQPDMLESLSYYRSLDFFPTGFFPLTHERDGLTVIEFDVVLARSIH